MKKRIVYVVSASIVLLPVVLIAGLSMFSTRPDNLGVANGRLAACPSSPNCVSSQATDPRHQIEPIAFQGSPQEAMQKIKAALKTIPRLSTKTETDDYLHAEATSFLFRFVDDVEFFVDAENGSIHFRSASRVGRSDFGANRSRMERFRQAFEQAEW